MRDPSGSRFPSVALLTQGRVVPVVHLRESHDGIRYVRLTDPWSMREVIDHVADRLDSGVTGPEVSVLVEYSSRRIPSFAEVREWTNFVGNNRYRVPSFRAIVVTAPVLHGMARVAMAYLDYKGVSLNVFRTVEKAETWLRDQGSGTTR